MTDSLDTSDREAEDPREPIRLPVREMRDEPAPQRAAQEGDLPPLLTDEQIREVVRGMGFISLDPYKFARAIESEVRLALAAAGGGVPKANSIQRRAASLHSKTGMPWDASEQLALSEAGIDDKAIDELIGECGYMGLESLLTTPDELRQFTRSVLVHQPLASSPQPEAAQQGPCEAVAARYDFDGYGYQYIDEGSGSDWRTRHKDAELLCVCKPAPQR